MNHLFTATFTITSKLILAIKLIAFNINPYERPIFIVGALKCCTTVHYTYWHQHSLEFMPHLKMGSHILMCS